jgi:hypothetical protein
VALEKLKALVRAANRVRAELPATRTASRNGRGESPATQGRREVSSPALRGRGEISPVSHGRREILL